MRYKFFINEEHITEIGHSDICVGASFKLDKPLSLSMDDVVHLIDGQWFLEVSGDLKLLEGRWVRNKQATIKAPKVKINERATDPSKNT